MLRVKLGWGGAGLCSAEDNDNQRPALITRLEELPEDTAQEVGWYLQDACLFQIAPLLQTKSNQFEAKCHTNNEHNELFGTDWTLANEEGMGSRLIWHGLARWHAYAVS